MNPKVGIRLSSIESPNNYRTDFVNKYDALNPFYIETFNYGRFGFKKINSSVPAVAFVSGYNGISFNTNEIDPTSTGSKLYISKTGNVGIGTINPGAKLELNS